MFGLIPFALGFGLGTVVSPRFAYSYSYPTAYAPYPYPYPYRGWY